MDLLIRLEARPGYLWTVEIRSIASDQPPPLRERDSQPVVRPRPNSPTTRMRPHQWFAQAESREGPELELPKGVLNLKQRWFVRIQPRKNGPNSPRTKTAAAPMVRPSPIQLRTGTQTPQRLKPQTRDGSPESNSIKDRNPELPKGERPTPPTPSPFM